MKKFAFVLILLGAMGPAFAKGSTTLGALGLNYSLLSAYTGGLGLTGVVGHQNRPFQFTGQWDFGAGGGLGFTADWLFLRNPIAKTPLWYYLGIGAGVGIRSSAFNLGARLPIAIQWFPISQVELYAEAAPGLRVLTAMGFDFALTFGARYHFGAAGR